MMGNFLHFVTCTNVCHNKFVMSSSRVETQSEGKGDGCRGCLRMIWGRASDHWNHIKEVQAEMEKTERGRKLALAKRQGGR